MVEKRYDTLHMGRSSIDLYSNDVGAPFEEIGSFAAYVGGSPTNISVGARRLGLKSALLTGFGLTAALLPSATLRGLTVVAGAIVAFEGLRELFLLVPPRIKAAAERYPYMDLNRIGIYGGSAGGQSSTRGILMYPGAQLSALHGLTDLFAGCGQEGDSQLTLSGRKQSWSRPRS